MTQLLSVRWNNRQVNMFNVFADLLESDSFVDVTLACEGESIKAHKLVLSACSPFFRDLLMNNPCQHPIIILNNINFKDVRILVDFMYKGQVQVSREKLQDLFKAAEMLKIRGLGEVGKASKLANDKGAGKSSKSGATNRKQSDHHYSCSSPKAGNKRKKVSPEISELKLADVNEEIMTESVEAGKMIEEENKEVEEQLQTTEYTSDSVINESDILPIAVDQSNLESETNTDMSELKATEVNANDECILTLPLVEADENNSISGLPVSQLEGKQLAQVMDSSGNTILVLLPEQGTSEPVQSTSEEVICSPNPGSAKKQAKKKRSRDSKVDEPDYSEMHFKKSDGSTMKLYQCLQCDSKFANPGNVRRHTYSAHKGYRIECEVCHSLFTQKSSKDFHFRTVHAGLRYHCDKCDAQFTEKRGLLYHISSVHDKEQTT